MADASSWLAALSAFGSAVAAVIAASTAKKQLGIGKREIDVALIDRRIAIYEDLNRLINKALTAASDEFSESDYQELISLRRRAEYFFGPDVVDWLHDTLHPLIHSYIIDSRQREDEDDPGKRKELGKKMRNSLEDLWRLQKSEFPDRFAPYLEVWRTNDVESKRSWLRSIQEKIQNKPEQK